MQQFLPTRRLATLCIVLLAAVACAQPRKPSGPPVSGEVRAGEPRIVLVSLDGFRWDYFDRFDAPALRRLGDSGARAQRLIPPFPTLTFPGHYSIATGLTPGRHGIVANRFLDPASGRRFSFTDRVTVEDGWWYGGEPIWVAAETQGMSTAAFMFVGTEADVGGVRPSRWTPFSDQIPGEERVDQVLAWLDEPRDARPRFMTLYFEHVDMAGHRYGTDSAQLAAAVRKVDGFVERLLQGISALEEHQDIYVVVVSDHGMRDVDPGHPPFIVEDTVDLTGVEAVYGGSFVLLHLPDGAAARAARDRISAAWTSGRAYLQADAPPSWGLNDNPRFGNLILMADPGTLVFARRQPNGPKLAARHGWAPEDASMHGILLVAGPGIAPGTRLPAVRNVDVYPLLAAILDLEAARDIDGDPAVLGGLVTGSPAPTNPEEASR
jgi:predicted AlkP superfamily pyrophosphatase or phosphodiesterase